MLYIDEGTFGRRYEPWDHYVEIDGILDMFKADIHRAKKLAVDATLLDTERTIDIR